MTTRGVFIKSQSTGSEKSNRSHNNRRPRRRASLLEELDTLPSQHSSPSLSRRNSHGSNYTASSNNTAMVNNKTAASASASTPAQPASPTTTAPTASTTTAVITACLPTPPPLK